MEDQFIYPSSEYAHISFLAGEISVVAARQEVEGVWIAFNPQEEEEELTNINTYITADKEEENKPICNLVN